MVVEVNTVSDLAKLFGSHLIYTVADIIAQQKKQFDTNTSTYEKNSKTLIHSALAPSMGREANLAKSLKSLDDKLKVMVSVSTRQLLKLRAKGVALDWHTVEGCFNTNPTAEPMDATAVEVSNVLTSCKEINFNFDGTPDPAMMSRVMHWWESEAIPNPDIRTDSRIDVDMLARIVAQSGAAVKDLFTLVKHDCYEERGVFEIGVMRYPTIEEPYFMLYRIRVSAYAECRRVLWHETNNNGIRSTLTYRRYKAKESFIGRLRKQVVQQAVEEIDALYT
ncbi:hypothetical protein AX17_003095 [Amanita inopinata Kibby_2008]|nr:hypothetical protein AX17_003095 [Amanita inopinata Kibby_2008]